MRSPARVACFSALIGVAVLYQSLVAADPQQAVVALPDSPQLKLQLPGNLPDIFSKLPSDVVQDLLPQIVRDLPPGSLREVLAKLRDTTSINLGTPTPPGQFRDVPRVTALPGAGYTSPPSCTSVVLSARHALTARHCLPGYVGPVVGADVTLKRGEWTGGLSARVTAEHFDGDLAFLCLDDSAPAQSVQDAPILPDQALTLQSEKVVVVGYGATSKPENLDAFGPFMGDSVVTTSSDLELLATTTADAPNLACKGDSGGPAYLVRNGRKVLIGIARAYQDEKDCGKPVRYTRLDAAEIRLWLQTSRAACSK